MRDMAPTVTHLVAMESALRVVLPVAAIPVIVFAATRHGSVIAMVRVEAVIDIPMEMGTAMEPGPAPMKMPLLNHSGP
jgi:hypothetical protein